MCSMPHFVRSIALSAWSLGLHRRGPLDLGNHLLDLRERRRKPARQRVGKKAERRPTLAAVLARDLHAGRLHPRVRPMTREAATATRMQGAPSLCQGFKGAPHARRPAAFLKPSSQGKCSATPLALPQRSAPSNVGAVHAQKPGGSRTRRSANRRGRLRGVGAAPDAQRATCPVWRPSRRRALGRSGGLAEGLEEPAHLVRIAHEREDAHAALAVRARESVDTEAAEQPRPGAVAAGCALRCGRLTRVLDGRRLRRRCAVGAAGRGEDPGVADGVPARCGNRRRQSREPRGYPQRACARRQSRKSQLRTRLRRKHCGQLVASRSSGTPQAAHDIYSSQPARSYGDRALARHVERGWRPPDRDGSSEVRSVSESCASSLSSVSRAKFADFSAPPLRSRSLPTALLREVGIADVREDGAGSSARQARTS